ncbi:hypothetical protein A3D11_02280 [Candidatus Peribacteria bacterium RIFCSPHIGHO2_02_FULL_49_16]|nr:MAG: hypothetical protein A2880_03740 [Candidatus Peribacteria bacterium RIFCSPHIGHO2_01_FULL_49_38]OGJ59953.1 MAG: hypothetical protein A3D11_02280 [Candidatus Peribacteria bacterium RIFCSPHIGHO2_02_FULL_49_16]
MSPIEERFRESLAYLDANDRHEVEKALETVKIWHEGQMRKSGEPYVDHPIAAANYLAKLECGKNTLIAGLCHDTVEDECATLEEIERAFGTEVMKLVDAVTKLTKLQYEGRRSQRQIASLRKMLLAASEDLRVIMIKLADRLHNVETLEVFSLEKQKRIASETLDIYVPFARLMGLWWMKRCFEERCFPLAYEDRAIQWQRHVNEHRERLLTARREFCHSLHSFVSVPIDTTLTRMTDYELFLRCDSDSEILEESSLLDSISIVPKDAHASLEICYAILADIHQHVPFKSASFRDCIGQPLTNGYQALHTTVFLSHNHQVRLRIQTKSMLEYAEMRKYSSWMKDKENNLYRALNSLHQRFIPHDQYMMELKNDVLKEKVSVFTPAGEIVTLPSGSNGIDLAFALNPDFFARLTGMRVNGQEQEVTHPLYDGNTVELILSSQDMPEEFRALWRQRASTGDARTALQEKAQDLPQNELLAEGRLLLTNECQKHRLPAWLLFHAQCMQRALCEQSHVENFSVLLRDIGAGYRPVKDVMYTYDRILKHPPTWATRFLALLIVRPHVLVLHARSTMLQLDISSDDRPGIVHEITRCFADRNINMSSFTAYSLPKKGGLYKIWLSMDDFEQFSDLFDALLQVPGVKKVSRVQ